MASNNNNNTAGSGGGGGGGAAPDEYLQEHELHATWVLWEHSKNKTVKDYNQTELATFKTVEEFWRVWSFLPRISEVSKLKGLDAFSVFKRGIQPKWEDENNNLGCQFDFIIEVDNKEDTIIDIVWEDLVIACLGQILEVDNDICGIRAVDRTLQKKPGKKGFYRLELWMRGATTDEVAEQIKCRLIEAIDGSTKTPPIFTFTRRQH